jgi:hypothetical protein
MRGQSVIGEKKLSAIDLVRRQNIEHLGVCCEGTTTACKGHCHEEMGPLLAVKQALF